MREREVEVKDKVKGSNAKVILEAFAKESSDCDPPSFTPFYSDHATS